MASMVDSRAKKSSMTSSLDRKIGRARPKKTPSRTSTPRHKTSTEHTAQVGQEIRGNSRRGVSTSHKANRGKRISSRPPTTNQDIINRIDNSHMIRMLTRNLQTSTFESTSAIELRTRTITGTRSKRRDTERRQTQSEEGRGRRNMGHTSQVRIVISMRSLEDTSKMIYSKTGKRTSWASIHSLLEKLSNSRNILADSLSRNLSMTLRTRSACSIRRHMSR